MNFAERFQRLMKALNLTTQQMAEIFGVDDSQMRIWINGLSVPHAEFRNTLTRLEADNMAAISPHLKAETIKAFRDGKRRGQEVLE